MTNAQEKAIADMLISIIDSVDPPMIMRGVEKEVTANAIKFYSNELIAILDKQHCDIILSGATNVLAYSINGEDERIIPCNYGNGKWFDCIFNCEITSIVAWMPLPSPYVPDTKIGELKE